MNGKWKVALGALALVVAACSTAQPAADEADGAQSADRAETGDKTNDETPTLPSFAPAPGAATIESLSWGADGSLRLGFADGKWAGIDPGGKQAHLSAAVGAEASVLALSPKAKLAFVASEPPTIIRLRDHEAVMRLTDVEALETAGFFAGGEGLFVVEPSGKLHVWSESEAELDEISTKDLKHFMARQTPTFTANLSALRGQVLVTDSNALILATRAGKVLRWKPDRPEEIDAVVQLPAAATSFGFDGRFIAATAADGSLRAISLFEGSFLPWSMKESGELVAASEQLLDKFAVADRDTVGLRAFKDGAWDWQAELPAGELCGLTLSPDAQTLAVCVDSGVVLVEPQTGELRAALRRAGDVIEWR